MIRTADGESRGTQRDSLEALAKKGDAAARATLAKHPLPRAFRTLWRHFCAINHWRGAGGFGAAPLTLPDIDAYERRFGVVFMAGELDLIKQLDAITLAPS